MLNKGKDETNIGSGKNTVSINKGCSASSIQTMFVPKHLTEKQAFNMFLKNDQNNVEVNTCTKALKNKIETAKSASGKLKFCKNNISKLSECYTMFSSKMHILFCSNIKKKAS